MPQQLIAGPGLGLPLAQSGYPVTAGTAPYIPQSNKFGLGPAQTFVIPAGDFIVSTTGTISAVQYNDPQQQQWTNYAGPGTVLNLRVRSDGVNWRINNLSDSAYGALISAAGAGYTAGATTIAAGTGNSTWVAVVGGALGTISIITAGAGYTIPPILLIPPPPVPGVPASAKASISGGTISAVSLIVAGAGYPTVPPVTVLPVQTDPAYIAGLVTNATMAVSGLVGAGTLTAVLLQNFGAPLTTAPTLSVSGTGSIATITTNPATVVAAANDTITLQPT